MLHKDEEVTPARPKCEICGKPTACRPIWEAVPLCMVHVGQWFGEPRFRGNLGGAEAIRRTHQWVAEKRAQPVEVTP